VRRAEQEPSGLLRVTISVGLGLGRIGDLVNDFVRAHPKIEVDLLLTSRVVDLTTERIDVAIRAGRLSSSGHKVRRIGESEFRLFASPSYLQQHGTPARPEELTHHACLRLTFSPERMNTFELHRGKRRVRVPVRGPFSANEIGAVHKAALSGLGIAFLPITICQADVEEGRLIPVLPRWSSERTPLHLVLPAQPFVPAKARAFVDFMRRALAEQPL